MSDVNIEGHVSALVGLILRSDWLEIWNHLDVEICTFSELGLSDSDVDRDVWNAVQKHQIILITNNRNNDGPDSLQAAIDDSNVLASLPVITIGDSDRFLNDPDYAERVAVKLIEKLTDIELHRGTGRIYIP